MAGQLRAELYRQGIGRSERAMREGFYIEAIAIQESVIADRLEYLLESVYGGRQFRSLGRLLSIVRSKIPEDQLDDELLRSVEEWSKRRNAAVHRMVKFSEFHDISWRQRLADCRSAAFDGRRIMRETDAWVRRTRKRLNQRVD